MYFFYIDESGTRDCPVKGIRPDGTPFEKEHLYVLTAVSLYERKWRNFEREITNLKLEFRDRLYRSKHLNFDLADCEVKSTWLRIPKQREAESAFLHALSDADRKRLSETFYAQLAPNHMHVFSVVIDKRKLRDHMNHMLLHKKAYELLLERIQSYLAECHANHQGVIVMDDTHKKINRDLTMKHSFFQREGNKFSTFKNIVEYPFFTDSKLSNGVQLADLCGYNVYRAFRSQDFKYPYFQNLLRHFYKSQKGDPMKLNGLKVWPDDSELVKFGRQGWMEYKTEQPALL